ncbi:MAG: ABC transporter permease [Acidimicrobiales bacterium]
MLLAVTLPLPTVIILGLITGAVYSIMAMGIVAIFKATRVPNFAFGATATFIALFHYQAVGGHTFALNLNWLFVHVHLRHSFHPAFWAMVPASLVLAAILGLAIDRVVMRAFAEAPTISLIIVSVGLYLVMSGLSGRLFGINDRFVTGAEAPFSRSRTVGVLGVHLTYERLGILAISMAIAAGIFAFFRLSRTGLAIRALATKRDVAQLCGVSARRLSVLSWVGGTVLAGIVGILLSAQQVTLNTTNLTLTAVVGFIAAVIGGMTSLPIAFGAGLGLGVLQELVQAYYPSTGIHLLGHTFTPTGMPEAASVVVALAILVSRPRWIFRGNREDEDSGVTLRPLSRIPALARAFDPVQGWRAWSSALGRPLVAATGPAAGNGSRTGPLLRHRRVTVWRLTPGRSVVVIGSAMALGWPIIGVNHDVYGLDATLGLVYLLLALSIVVLTGWVGQISLAQGAFIAVGGVGTLIAANVLHLPFPLPVVFAAAFSVPFSLLIGVPALRLRGLYLAIATLAFGYAASRLVAGNLSLAQSTSPPINLFGWHARSGLEQYYCLAGVTAVVLVLCWRVSVSRPGRAFYAVRDSETVAAAYGINPTSTKLIGFVLAGAVAAVAGAVLTYVIGQPGGGYTDIFFSITWLAYVVVGGIGSIGGAVIAAVFFGLLPLISTARATASSTGSGAEIVAGALLILVMMVNPGGLASMARFVRRRASAHDDEPSRDVLQTLTLATTAVPAAEPALAAATLVSPASASTTAPKARGGPKARGVHREPNLPVAPRHRL